MLTRFFPIPVALAIAIPGSAPLAAQDAAPAVLAACDSDALCSRVPRPVGLYISAVEEDGRYLALEDGSLWEVEISDRATTASWAPDDFLNLSLIAAPREDFEYLLRRAGDLEQKAAARLAGRRPGPAGQDPAPEDPTLEPSVPEYPDPDADPGYPEPEYPAPEDPAEANPAVQE
ncbi:MAG TPA: hypothetical protein VHG35_03135 [Gemmatimonadales bacterium]|nr:hypothetical protein [Gemmatimonadales bacterium]